MIDEKKTPKKPKKPKKRQASLKNKVCTKDLEKKLDRISPVIEKLVLYEELMPTADEIISYFKKDWSPAMIAAKHKLSLNQFKKTLELLPLLKDAYEVGFTILKARYDQTLFNCALGIPQIIKVAKRDREGNEVIKEYTIRPNTALLIFIGKSRFGMRDVNPEINIQNNVTDKKDGTNPPITINIIAEEADL